MSTRSRTKFGGLIDHERGGVWLSSGGKTTDTPCPRGGELVNVACWKCGWKRDPQEREQTIANHGGKTFLWRDTPSDGDGLLLKQ